MPTTTAAAAAPTSSSTTTTAAECTCMLFTFENGVLLMR